MAWLSDWLRDIIAIILLAVFVELLLPNKAMQRYARLVVGLFILLTILSPILKLIQSDIGAKLDEGMKSWSETAMSREVQMTGLNQITRDAEAMRQKRSLDAARLTERTLEASIQNELNERTEAPVAEVDAVLKWVTVSGEQTPYISQVVVTLKALDDQGGSANDSAVEAVQPVIVDVEIDPISGELTPQGGDNSNGETGKAEEAAQAEGKWSRADPATASSISSLITKGWGVDADQIVVRQPVQRRSERLGMERR
ncbi:stage III sporulation protein AF [Paenibacillus sp. PL91]|uniref:stage III sporulation protein AF n=1 Tax=Paenibacillus sp. PL91 TaxID=2729538 RepID=UPI001CB89368|nr:stage III sporulation protein AF [Paenibacillus sp. PL91]